MECEVNGRRWGGQRPWRTLLIRSGRPASPLTITSIRPRWGDDYDGGVGGDDSDGGGGDDSGGGGGDDSDGREDDYWLL